MEYVTLNNGVKMPILGYGTMRVKNLSEVIPAAVSAGYRLIDTAANYDNETEVGKAIRLCDVPREDLFITSKMQILTDGSKTEQAVDNSLKNLGTDYLDLYLIHQPYGDIYGEWRALEKAMMAGKIRAIGVANFEPFRLMDLMLHNEVKPAVNQIEVHPFCQMKKEHAFDEENGIQTMAWAPFAQNKNTISDQPILKELAAKYHKSVQQVILRWVTQREIAAIPRSTSSDHAVSNMDIFDFHLADEDMQEITGLDTGKTLFLDHLDPGIVKTLSRVVANPIEVGDARPSHDEWYKQSQKIESK